MIDGMAHDIIQSKKQNKNVGKLCTQEQFV